MRIVKVLSRQAARSMQVATRRGNTFWVTGATGTTYRVEPKIEPVNGELYFECNCGDWVYRKAVTLAPCKHGKVVQERNNGDV